MRIALVTVPVTGRVVVLGLDFTRPFDSPLARGSRRNERCWTFLRGRRMSIGPGDPFFGGGGMFQPRGPYGPWGGCGCSSLFIILAGILLVMGGCLRMLGQ